MAAHTVQVALNAAGRGETIWITNGVYELDRALVLDKPVKVKGFHGAAVTTLQPGTNSNMRLILLQHSNADVSGLTLRGGRLTSGAGAAIYIQRGYVYNCIIRGNTNTAGQVAGVYLGDVNSARIANSLLFNNTMTGGSGSAAIQGQGSVVNCTVAGNSPAGISASAVYNTISDGAINATEVLYSLSPNLHAGAGNLSGTPSFADAGAGDYHLVENSIGIDQGRNAYNTLPNDLDGRARIVSVIDMGAYESLPAEGLAISIGADPSPVAQGQELVLSLQAWNGGPNAAIGVEVQTDLSDALLVATNIAAITAQVADPSLSAYRWATNVVTVLGDVIITNVAASTSSGNSTVEWTSVVGLSYSVHSFDGAYTDEPSWAERGTLLASDEVRTFLDTDASAAQDNARFYQVSYTGQTPDTNHIWGVIRVPVRASSYTMVSAPLTSDRRFDGKMGAALAEALSGHDGGVGDRIGDEIYIMEANGSWRILYLDSQNVWRESNGSVSTHQLAPGQGVYVARHTGSPSLITFTGEVGNSGTNRLTIVPGWNLVSLSEGKDLQMAIAFESANPRGAASEEDADLVVIQNTNGTWRRLMRVQGWGAPYDGKWFDLSTFQITTLSLKPGQAYYYFRQSSGGATQISY
jgi:hypothetical protein